VADLLGTTVASVNSALQRARATLATRACDAPVTPFHLNDDDRALLAGYATAFEGYDIGSLVGLAQQDALQHI
jgi:RNA polymerase sigma-70 factor (ECF subfamily)